MAGRSKKIPITPEAIGIIEGMAGRGAVLNDIAKYLNIGPSTLDRWLKEPEVRQAYDRGRIHAIDAVAEALYQSALAGDTTAQIFYLKSQAKWRDYWPVDDAKEAPAVVHFYLPELEPEQPESPSPEHSG